MLLEKSKATMGNKQNETEKALCRICATSGSGNMYSIYSKQGELWDVVEKIGCCLPIIVLPTDILPLNICSKCLTKLNASYELVLTSLNSEAALRAKFDLDDPSVEPAEECKDYVGVKQEQEFVEVKEEIHIEAEKLSSLNDSKEGCYKNAVKMTAEVDDILDNGDAKKTIKVSSENNSFSETPTLSVYGPATCDLCDVTFTDMDQFDEHVECEHLLKHKFRCSRCDESFEQSLDLVLHKARVHNEEPISCTHCQNKREMQSPPDEEMEEEWLEEAEFASEENIYQDKSNGVADVCEVCGKGFENAEILKDHYLTHVSPKPICNKCGLKFGTWYELSIHKKIHFRNVKDKRLVCDVCKKSFTERIMFNLHRRSCMSKQYVCHICNRVFWRKYSLQLHMKKEKPFECSCGQKFHSANLLVAHKKTHEIGGAMRCVTCNKVFTNETFYKRHRYIHDPEFWDRFKCQTCQRPFRDAHALKNHMQLHYGIKPHMCDLCGRTYNRYANMLKHRKLHKPQNQWEHNCARCESKFERLKDLMAHIEQAHTEGVVNNEDNGTDKKSSTKWICRFCGKRISTKLSLQDHERIHTGAKPYICEWCGREFRSRPNLLQHHLTHTGDRKHACGVCGKRFARKSFIAQHMRVHTGEKPYECDLCGKRFTQAGDMRRHRNRHAKKPEEGLALFVQLQQ